MCSDVEALINFFDSSRPSLHISQHHAIVLDTDMFLPTVPSHSVYQDGLPLATSFSLPIPSLRAWLLLPNGLDLGMLPPTMPLHLVCKDVLHLATLSSLLILSLGAWLLLPNAPAHCMLLPAIPLHP